MRILTTQGGIFVQRNNQIKAAKIGYIMISILLCVLGIVVIAMADFSVMLLCRLGGGIMVLFGLVKIVGYCSKDLYRLAFYTKSIKQTGR